MTRIPCYDKEGNTIKSLTQWDKNQSVYIDDLENGSLPRVHFALGSNAKKSKEYKDNVEFDGKKIKITIPNELLKTYAKMYLFLYYGDVESEEPLTTKYMVEIPITKKPQPDDYIYEDNVDYLSIYKLKLELSLILDNAANYAAESRANKESAETAAREAAGSAQEARNILSDVNASGANQIQMIETAGAEQTDAAKAEIDAKGKQTLDSIPEDYTGLQTEVDGLKGDLDDVSNVIYDMVEIDNGLSCRVASGYAKNNTPPSSLKAIGTLVTINDPIIKIVLNTSASSDDTLYCDITDESGTKVYASSSAEITTEKSNIVLDFPKNRIVGNVRLNFYTKNKNAIGYFAYPTAFIDSGFLTQANDGKYYYYISLDGIKYTKFDSELRQNMNFRLYTLKNVPKKTVENVIYVSIAGNDETGDGSKENPYATIYHANELITDNSESNPYKIIVANGTYTDLQERYAGIDGTWYQGVICKSYVTYQSEDINRPDLCILEWDGSVGYEKPVTNNNCVNKCIFHIKDNTQGVHIKGFTFKSKNTRYCMHIETVGATMACDWHFENCVFEWGGRPDEDDDGTVTRACVGTGYSMLEFGEFVNCIFKCTNTNSANHMIFQTHDNTDPDFSSIKCGEHIRFENCFFSVADGSAYAHFDLRQTINTPQIKSFVELINCSGLPIYAPSTTYNKSFVCTEQHT